MHGCTHLLLARFDARWEYGEPDTLDTFPPHVVLTKPFFPRVPRSAILTGNIEPLTVTFNSVEPNRPVVIGKKQLQKYASQILAHVGEDVALVDDLVVAGRVDRLESNVLRVRGLELVQSIDAKHNRYRVE